MPNHDDGLRFFAGLLWGVPLGALLWVLLVILALGVAR